MNRQTLLIALLWIGLRFPATAQWVVSDPSAIAQRMGLASENIATMIDQGIVMEEQLTKLNSQLQTARDAYDIGKRQYDRYKKINRYLKEGQSYLALADAIRRFGQNYSIISKGISTTRITANFNAEEVGSILTSVTAISEEAGKNAASMKEVVSDIMDDQYEMSDAERLHTVNDLRKNIDALNYSLFNFYCRINSISRYRSYRNQIETLIYVGDRKTRK